MKSSFEKGGLILCIPELFSVYDASHELSDSRAFLFRDETGLTTLVRLGASVAEYWPTPGDYTEEVLQVIRGLIEGPFLSMNDYYYLRRAVWYIGDQALIRALDRGPGQLRKILRNRYSPPDGRPLKLPISSAVPDFCELLKDIACGGTGDGATTVVGVVGTLGYEPLERSLYGTMMDLTGDPLTGTISLVTGRGAKIDLTHSWIPVEGKLALCLPPRRSFFRNLPPMSYPVQVREEWGASVIDLSILPRIQWRNVMVDLGNIGNWMLSKGIWEIPGTGISISPLPPRRGVPGLVWNFQKVLTDLFTLHHLTGRRDDRKREEIIHGDNYGLFTVRWAATGINETEDAQ